MFTLNIVTGLRVSELAERAGVAPSTVRFYERAGLLSPARRAANGYRVFEESALDELAFIARAKGIGMSLEDITDLVAAWPHGRCQSLQARMRVYLAGRISEVRGQLAELGAFERQLRTVLGRLSARDPGQERCGQGCGCETDLDLAAEETAHSPVPWGCSLGQDAPVSGAGQWREVAAAGLSAEQVGDAIRLLLPADPDVIASAAALCAAETARSPQARFLLEVTACEVTLTIQAPGAAGLPDILLSADPPIRS